MFVPPAALNILGLYLLALPQKFLIVAAFTNFISYLSFNDLVPTGLLTFNNIHYFTWSLAVMGVAAMATLSSITKQSIQNPRFCRRSLPILAGSWAFLSIATSQAQPQTNPIRVATSSPTTQCPAQRDPASNIRGKAAEFEFKAFTSPETSRRGATRLLNLNIKTSPTPTQIHLAHQDQIDLQLNGNQLLYRKDWRLVNHNKGRGNKLTILLHQSTPTHGLVGTIAIGQNSNINLNKVEFNQQPGETTKPSKPE